MTFAFGRRGGRVCTWKKASLEKDLARWSLYVFFFRSFHTMFFHVNFQKRGSDGAQGLQTCTLCLSFLLHLLQPGLRFSPYQKHVEHPTNTADPFTHKNTVL